MPGGPPGEFTLQSQTGSTANFLWTAPPTDQLNGVLTTYTIVCTNSEHTVTNNYGSDSTAGVLNDLTPARMYTCSIRAFTAPGEGPPAELILATSKCYNFEC